ncbi:YciI family protein [Ideonella sp. BN130291]|uniref:YciI family protein n=1 Tax=Ideonella sp. BN130291 TaxID=3112940 RepID=UPI002E2660D0|nr:YciI family protein [Ideonella sp. BN130291]
MAKYLISFPSSAMVIPEGEFQAVVDASHAVIAQAQAAGVYVFAGGINESIAPVKVSADGSVAEGTYPETRRIEGGYTILELPSREEAVAWAAKIAAACRCDQELREFMYDPMS